MKYILVSQELEEDHIIMKMMFRITSGEKEDHGESPLTETKNKKEF